LTEEGRAGGLPRPRRQQEWRSSLADVTRLFHDRTPGTSAAASGSRRPGPPGPPDISLTPPGPGGYALPAPMRHRKLKLHGFNNLTKSLSFNIYDVCYAGSARQTQGYLDHIDAAYDADRLVGIMRGVTGIIGARVLNVARQDYDPRGASVTMLLADGGATPPPPKRAGRSSALLHLDTSHIAVHTYPEAFPGRHVSTFRVDVEVSTCGGISPLKALDLLIRSFVSDIVVIDYRVRGFTRDEEGAKHYIDHRIGSIQDFISDDVKGLFRGVDINLHRECTFHTRLVRQRFDWKHYLFGGETLGRHEKARARAEIVREIDEIFAGGNA
jgi:S-adenosylmethionine decarboxylase